jgi:hypothetical protein
MRIRSPIWPDPRVKPPFGAAEVDRSHPLAQGLVACCLFNEGGGLPLEFIRQVTPTVNGTFRYAAAAFGLGWDTTNAGCATYANRSEFDSSAITFAWRATLAASQTAFAGIMVIADGSGYHYTLQDTSGNYVVYENGGANYATGLTIASLGGAPHDGVVAIYTDGTGVKGYKDGVNVGTTAFTPAAAVTGKPFRVGAERNTSAFIDGVFAHAYLYNRTLTATDALWLAQEPYAMLRPIVRRRYFVPVVVGGGGGTGGGGAAFIRQSATWPDPRVKPPFGTVEVDWTHPLSAGLVDLWLFNEGGGDAGNLANARHPFTRHGSVGYRAGVAGPMVDFPGNFNDYFSVAEASDADYTGPLTLLWRGVIRGNGIAKHFVGKHTSNGATQNPFDFRTEDFTTPLVLVRSNTNYAVWDGPSPPLSVLTTVGVTTPSGNIETTPTFYVDGVATSGTVAGAGTGAATGGGYDIRCGVRQDNSIIMDGQCSVLLIAKRAWSQSEMLWFRAEPFALLRPLVRRRYFVPAAPGGGITFTQLERKLRGVARGVAMGAR